jgi:hypothetical protein
MPVRLDLVVPAVLSLPTRSFIPISNSSLVIFIVSFFHILLLCKYP